MPATPATAYRRRFARSVRVACGRAAWIICPSTYTRDRLVIEYDADPQRITVNPWAPDSAVSRVDRDKWAPVLDRYNIRPPFVLHFGAAETRKNTRRVIEAWAMTDRQARRQWQLLIVGLDEHTRAALRQTSQAMGVAPSVHLHGFADESHLPTLLSAAEVLAYPSLSEGFGLPILDAWAVGTPVLTSNVTSLPEVAGDGAMMVDPLDTCAIARALSRLMQDTRCRAQLVDAGNRRLSQYSWTATADRFAQAIEQAAGAVRQARAA
jgi:glycosyltransferase involved in cell wall biosynthesis